MLKYKNEVRHIFARLCAIKARLGVRSMKGEHLGSRSSLLPLNVSSGLGVRGCSRGHQGYLFVIGSKLELRGHCYPRSCCLQAARLLVFCEAGEAH